MVFPEAPNSLSHVIASMTMISFTSTPQVESKFEEANGFIDRVLWGRQQGVLLLDSHAGKREWIMTGVIYD